jgi:thiosulfate dehydrogenase [quinone] large subunit
LKVAGITGPLLMMLLWLAQLPPTTNPFVDDHIIYALVLALFPLLKAGDTLGLGRWWAEKVRA